jgi:hypothetical protein
MKFSIEYGVFQLTVTVEPDNAFIPPPKKVFISKKDKKDLDKGLIAFYGLVIETKKGDLATTHYDSGVILTTNQEKLKNSLIKLLENGEYLEDIVDYWDLMELEEGPEWKQE